MEQNVVHSTSIVQTKTIFWEVVKLFPYCLYPCVLTSLPSPVQCTGKIYSTDSNKYIDIAQSTYIQIQLYVLNFTSGLWAWFKRSLKD